MSFVSRLHAQASSRSTRLGLLSPSRLRLATAPRTHLAHAHLRTSVTTTQLNALQWRFASTQPSILRAQRPAPPSPSRETHQGTVIAPHPSTSSQGKHNGDSSEGSSQSRLNPMWVANGLLGANLAVFLGWKYADACYNKDGQLAPHIFMRRNFTVSWNSILQGRVWTLVTSAFSQRDLAHFAFNMITIYSAVPLLLGYMGRPYKLIGFYLFSGAFASVGSLTWEAFGKSALGKPPFSVALGASGAAYAMLTALTCLRPSDSFRLYFLFPVPAKVIMPLLLTYDIYNIFMQHAPGIGSPAHVAGALFGLVWALRMKRRLPRNLTR